MWLKLASNWWLQNFLHFYHRRNHELKLSVKMHVAWSCLSTSECDEYIRIFKYLFRHLFLPIILIQIYSDTCSCQIYIRTFVRECVRVWNYSNIQMYLIIRTNMYSDIHSCQTFVTNIFGHLFVYIFVLIKNIFGHLFMLKCSNVIIKGNLGLFKDIWHKSKDMIHQGSSLLWLMFHKSLCTAKAVASGTPSLQFP